LLNYAYTTSLTATCSRRSPLEYFVHGSEFKIQKHFSSNSYVKNETECREKYPDLYGIYVIPEHKTP